MAIQTFFSQKILKWLSRIVLALLINPHVLQVFQRLDLLRGQLPPRIS